MIHVDRLCPLKPQTLSDEVLQEEKVSSKEVADEESECQEIEDTITKTMIFRGMYLKTDSQR